MCFSVRVCVCISMRVCVSMRVCMRVCVCVREREREGEAFMLAFYLLFSGYHCWRTVNCIPAPITCPSVQTDHPATPN